ncbi:unnamed protein product [Spirodela intermedia]|uniref:Uncharacterized protein n=1 Tax=Spirodela intermedia TaxID=51605 RepID=A0A7I8K0J9_SPIIN|nr:unnamed protein product [Spirodela intermedia]
MIPSIIWNCRGISNLETQFYIASLIRQYRLGIVGLIEPMISSDCIQPLLRRLGMDYFHSNPTNHIWLFWTRPYSMELLVEGSQYITMTVQDLTQEFTFSVIYASHRSEERETLWADLVQYVRDYPTLVESPWYLAGDFNCVCNTSERQGERIPRARNMETFNDCIFRLALIEPPTSGEVDALQKELAEVERLLQARYLNATWEKRSRVRDQLDEVVR